MISPVDYLIGAQHPSGGWGYQTNYKPVVEPTAAILLALREEVDAKDAFQRGVAWLLSSQNQDGGWGINEVDRESGWQTAWALMAMKYSDQVGEAISKAQGWLTKVSTYYVAEEEFQKSGIPQDSNIGALAWPWLPGQVIWIEPTALAMLALQGMNASPLTLARVSSALEYFTKYRTPVGGWNAGNEGPLDMPVSPHAYQTAIVLIALASTSPNAIQPVDITALKQDLDKDTGMLALATACLALRLLGKESTSLISKLSAGRLSDGSWESNPFVTAWAMMALRGYL